MKVRIKGDTIRIRVSQSEYDQIINEGYCEEVIHFPSGNLVYSVKSVEQIEPTADFLNGRIEVGLPSGAVTHWHEANEVGIYQDGPVKITVERDFQCLKPRAHEDETDLYPNPLAEEAG